MPKKGFFAILITAVGLWFVVTYRAPQIEEIGGVDASPSPLPSDTTAPSASPDTVPGATEAPGKSSTPKPTATPKQGTAMKDGSYTGTNTNYRYGMIEVTIEVSGGKVTKASVNQSGRWPIGYRNKRCTESDFNTRAIGIASGKAFFNLDFCSGATYSKWGYATSLQSAIDQAKQ